MKITNLTYCLAIAEWVIGCIDFLCGNTDKAIFALLLGFVCIAVDITSQMRGRK